MLCLTFLIHKKAQFLCRLFFNCSFKQKQLHSLSDEMSHYMLQGFIQRRQRRGMPKPPQPRQQWPSATLIFRSTARRFRPTSLHSLSGKTLLFPLSYFAARTKRLKGTLTEHSCGPRIKRFTHKGGKLV